ncbi:Nn.00g101560.m01.CDS01 [Neocucurbitaria sp. VM-36]
MPLPNQRRSSGEEDWTQITDSRLRKRIQNRLSQRKHREKIRVGSTNEQTISNSPTGGEASPWPTDAARSRSPSIEVPSTTQAQSAAIETAEDNSQTAQNPHETIPDVSPLTSEPFLDHTEGWNGNLMNTLLDYSGSNWEVNLETEVQASSSTSTWPGISQFPDLGTPPVSEVNNLSAGTDLTTSVTDGPSTDDFVPLATSDQDTARALRNTDNAP